MGLTFSGFATAYKIYNPISYCDDILWFMHQWELHLQSVFHWMQQYRWQNYKSEDTNLTTSLIIGLEWLAIDIVTQITIVFTYYIAQNFDGYWLFNILMDGHCLSPYTCKHCIVFKHYDELNFDGLAGKCLKSQISPRQNFVLYSNDMIYCEF